MNSIPEEQNLEIISLIKKLLPVPERNPHAVADGRAKFLAEAQSLGPAISKPPERRHIEWKTIFSRKVQPRMSIISTLLVIFTLVFGSTGVTVYAAQGSLPNQPLYTVKLASEDVRAGLITNNQTRLTMMLDFADLRVEEALQLATEGKAIPSTVWTRMESHFDAALHTTTRLDDEQLRQQLLQMQTRMAVDLSKLMQLSNDSRYRDGVANLQVTLQNDLQLIWIGMRDPSAFRRQMGLDQYPNGRQILTPTSSVTPPPTISPSMTPSVSSATQMPTANWNNQWQSPTKRPNNNWNNQWQNNHQNDCCCGGSNHHQGGGGWGHP